MVRTRKFGMSSGIIPRRSTSSMYPNRAIPGRQNSKPRRSGSLAPGSLPVSDLRSRQGGFSATHACSLSSRAPNCPLFIFSRSRAGPFAPRPFRAFGGAVHAAPCPSPNGGLPARATRASPRPTAWRFGRVVQPRLNVGLTHGVVLQFCPSPSRSPALTMPTTPWAPE